MIIKQANVLCDDFQFHKVDVELKDGIITNVAANLKGTDEVNAEGKMLIPGLVDIHTHGCVGYDTCDGDLDGYEKMSEFYGSQGVTSFLFTTMTFSEPQLTDILRKIRTFIDSGKGGAYAHGIYMEGPYINTVKKGAQNGKYIIQPDKSMFHRLQLASGERIQVAVIAPEMDNAMECIRSISAQCVVSLAHTDADYDVASEAFAAGAKNLTHTFNAMPPLHHRKPGPIGAALDNNVAMELICDGIHVHPSIIRMMFRLGLPDNIVLVSDSMRAAGMPDGTYSLGGQTVYMKHGKAVLEDGTIAGSAATLMGCVKNCIDFGIDPELAIKAASHNPSKLLGIDHLTGSISVGKSADLVLLEKDYTLDRVWVRGKKV